MGPHRPRARGRAGGGRLRLCRLAQGAREGGGEGGGARGGARRAAGAAGAQGVAAAPHVLIGTVGQGIVDWHAHAGGPACVADSTRCAPVLHAHGARRKSDGCVVVVDDSMRTRSMRGLVDVWTGVTGSTGARGPRTRRRDRGGSEGSIGRLRDGELNTAPRMKINVVFQTSSESETPRVRVAWRAPRPVMDGLADSTTARDR